MVSVFKTLFFLLTKCLDDKIEDQKLFFYSFRIKKLNKHNHNHRTHQHTRIYLTQTQSTTRKNSFFCDGCCPNELTGPESKQEMMQKNLGIYSSSSSWITHSLKTNSNGRKWTRKVKKYPNKEEEGKRNVSLKFTIEEILT